jgi:hypothetical protein
MTCGHLLRYHGVEGYVCIVIDADGPCPCSAYVACDHVPRSFVSRGPGQLFKVCGCGQTEVPDAETAATAAP